MHLLNVNVTLRVSACVYSPGGRPVVPPPLGLGGERPGPQPHHQDQPRHPGLGAVERLSGPRDHQRQRAPAPGRVPRQPGELGSTRTRTHARTRTHTQLTIWMIGYLMLRCILLSVFFSFQINGSLSKKDLWLAYF